MQTGGRWLFMMLIVAAGGFFYVWYVNHENDNAIVIRYMTWDSARGLEPERKIIERFEQQHPNIKISLEPCPQGYEDRVIVSLAGGKPPDVFLWWNYPRLMELGALEDLKPYLDSDTTIALEDFYPNLVKDIIYKGKVCGLLKDFTPAVLYYNKDLFDAAGIPYPDSDWTWDEFRDIAIQLTHGDTYGFLVDARDIYTLEMWVWSNGGDLMSPDGDTATGYLDSKATIEAIRFYTELYTKYRVSPGLAERASMGGGVNMFITGKLAMFVSGRWPLLQLKRIKGLRFGTVLPPHPKGKQLVTIIYQSAQVMAKESRHKKEAWEFLKAMTDTAAHRIRGEMGWAIPAYPEVVKRLGFDKDPIERPFIQAVKYATKKPIALRTVRWPEIERKIAYGMERIMLLNEDVEKVLKEVAYKIDHGLE